jgi:PIN domain nuclease of toxin-antitoxin system
MPIATNLKQNKVLLDTHVWLWFVEGDPTLKKKFVENAQRASAEQKLCISIISIWELGMLEAKKRVTLGMDTIEWVERSLNDHGIQMIPISLKVAIESTKLPIEYHGDPADRFLIATAHEEHAVLVTCDNKLLDYGKGRHITVYNPSI